MLDIRTLAEALRKARCSVAPIRLVRLAFRIRWGLLAAISMCSATAAAADYRVGVGDVIQISVVGIPELQQAVLVQADGRISFPLMGSPSVSGLALPELRARIKANLGSKIFRRKAASGLVNAIVIEPEEVTVTVVTYRPIYVKGDVLKPGEYAYRPFMTVRQAIALSAGYGFAGLRAEDRYLKEADLRSEYETLWLEFAKEKAHVWRIKTEIGEDGQDKEDISRSVPVDAPIPRAAIAKIVGHAAKQLETRQANHQREQMFMRQTIEQVDQQIEVFSKQEEQEEQGAEADAKELKRLTGLLNRGSTTSRRVTDARRAVLLSSTRKLQTTAKLMEARKRRSDLSRQLQMLVAEKKLALQQELETATLQLSKIQTRLRSVSKQLQYTATLESDVVGRGGSEPGILIHRMGEKGWRQSIGDEATELEPGDVVEVRLRPANSLSNRPASERPDKSAAAGR